MPGDLTGQKREKKTVDDPDVGPPKAAGVGDWLEYYLCHGESAIELQDAVNKKLRVGWQLHGSPVIAVVFKGSKLNFFQAVTKMV